VAGDAFVARKITQTGIRGIAGTAPLRKRSTVQMGIGAVPQCSEPGITAGTA